MFRVLITDDEDAILAPDSLGEEMGVSNLSRHWGAVRRGERSILGDLVPCSLHIIS